MPKKEIDYKKTVIYKIVSKDLSNDFVYVGSTTDFTQRKYAHKRNCTNENNNTYTYKIYKTIRENGGWNEFQMIKIENYPCNDKNDCLSRERYWFEQYHANMNSDIPGRKTKEYYKDKKVEILENKKIYDKLNKERISKRQSKKNNCICGGKYTNCHKSNHLKTPKHQIWLKKQNRDSESSSDSETSSSDDNTSSDSESSDSYSDDE
jgi:hypothetical protein